MYDKILLALDGSPESVDAAKFAADLASAHNTSSVAVVAVLGSRGLLRRRKDAEGNPIATEAQRQAVSEAVAALDAAGVHNEIVILGGNPADEIGRYAEADRADLIVTGSHFFRKVAKGVQSGRGKGDPAREHQVGCPVLVVRTAKPEDEACTGKEAGDAE